MIYMFEKISLQVKKFEQIYNGIEDAFIDVIKIKKVKSGFLCTITIYEDDFSSKALYRDIFYPLSISKLT